MYILLAIVNNRIKIKLHTHTHTRKTVKPLFSDKIQTPGSITLLYGDELVSDDKKVAEILNEYFVNITASLKISGVEENLAKPNEVRDPANIA